MRLIVDNRMHWFDPIHSFLFWQCRNKQTIHTDEYFHLFLSAVGTQCSSHLSKRYFKGAETFSYVVIEAKPVGVTQKQFKCILRCLQLFQNKRDRKRLSCPYSPRTKESPRYISEKCVSLISSVLLVLNSRQWSFWSLISKSTQTWAACDFCAVKAIFSVPLFLGCIFGAYLDRLFFHSVGF